MNLSRSFRLFRVADIDIRIHPSFILLPAFLGFFYAWQGGWEMGLRGFTLVLIVFLCVLAHEFCHSLKARSFGIQVPEITLYLMGGVAGMQRIPREPKKEFWIAIVGPLFNFGLALILFFPLYGILGKDLLFTPGLESWPQMIANVFWINPVLGAFNLIPAFPMDGGRILRSALAARMNYLKATRISVSIGRIFAILFVFSGIYYRIWMLVVIAGFIYVAASREEKQVIREDFLRSRPKDAGLSHEPKD